MKKNKKKKINVAHILPSLGLGGGEKLVLDLCKFLNTEIFDVKVISLFPPQSTIYEQIAGTEGIEIIYLNKKKGIDFKIIFSLAKVLRKEKIDIVHTHLYVMPYVLIASVIAGVKIRIHTVHNVAVKELDWFRRKIMSIAYRYFNATPVAISDYIQDTIEKEYKISKEKIPCIYNGIDTKSFVHQKVVESNRIKFINVARLTRQKNQRLLLDAFYLALQKRTDLLLEFVGDGELRNVLQDQAQELGIANHVVFRGIQKNIKEILNQSDVFILTSDWEGLPLSVLEAMACGLPVISTDAGGVRDIVKNNENGLIIEIGDVKGVANAIGKLATDKELRKEMGENSLRMAGQYDVRKMTREYETLYLSKLYR